MEPTTASPSQAVAAATGPAASGLDFLALSKLRWQTSDSRAVAHWAYSRDAARLWVVYRSNPARAYAYERVSTDIVLDMLDAPSLGSFISRHIRNRYPDTRVELGARAAEEAA